MKKDFRIFLQQQFAQRLNENPSYSIRAFAKILKIDQSLLTKILGGKRKISEKTIRQLAPALDLSPVQLEEFLKPLMQEDLNLSPSNKLTEDDLSVVAQWHHFAILELLQVENFDNGLEGISKKLGIELEVAGMAIEDLVQRGLLEEKNGKFKPSTANNNWIANHSSAARKNLQKQFLEKATHALYNVDISERENTSLTIAVDRSKLDEFRRIIQHAKNSLRALAEESKSYSDVYQLVVGFYPLTEMEKAKND